MRRPLRAGFTLVELLAVIGIIALLISILLPSLNRAREQAKQIKCASNLRSVGQGIMMYLANNKQVFPASYVYAGQRISGNTQTPAAADNGYVHWSGYLYGNTQSSIGGTVAADAFTCPSIERGGLPPTNTTSDNLDPGQSNDNGNVVDEQVPRLAVTLNEAICPRNKWVAGFQGAQRAYQFVAAARVKNSSGTILAAEWNQNWRIVADTGRSDPNSTVCKSHRPVHGFVGIAGELNMDQIPPSFRGVPSIRKVTVDDLDPDPQPGGTFRTRLDWVGRHHGGKRKENGFNVGMSNFLYVDGHVETKSIRDTVYQQEWGEQFYSLRPGDDIAATTP